MARARLPLRRKAAKPTLPYRSKVGGLGWQRAVRARVGDHVLNLGVDRGDGVHIRPHCSRGQDGSRAGPASAAAAGWSWRFVGATAAALTARHQAALGACTRTVAFVLRQHHRDDARALQVRREPPRRGADRCTPPALSRAAHVVRPMMRQPMPWLRRTRALPCARARAYRGRCGRWATRGRPFQRTGRCRRPTVAFVRGSHSCEQRVPPLCSIRRRTYR